MRECVAVAVGMGRTSCCSRGRGLVVGGVCSVVSFWASLMGSKVL